MVGNLRKYKFIYYFQNNEQNLENTFAISFTRDEKKNAYGEWVWDGVGKVTDYFK
jgi:hypothetical protein